MSIDPMPRQPASPADGTVAESPLRVRARSLSKVYRLYDKPWHRLVEALGGPSRHRRHEALGDLEFELRAGETLGVVGQNGAGKSTLLKILAGVLQPSSGELLVDGTVSSILELGAGFHPEFTGRQNIRINAAMLGLDEARLEERLPAIVDFCELGSFLDQPVKVYSSGMSMRLAFAIATQVEPEILIIDEALSVGDGYFQKKCMDRILELIDGGTSLLFCSHAMYYVSTLCQRVLWLDGGRTAAYGDTDEVVQAYEEFLLARGQQAAGASDPDHLVERRVERDVRLVDVQLDADHRELLPEDGIRPGQTLGVQVSWISDEDLSFQVGVGINRIDGVEFSVFDTRESGIQLDGRGRHTVRFEVPDQPLLRGQFTLYVTLLDETALHVYDQRVLHDAFRIAADGGYEFGLARVPFRVEVVERPGDD